MPPIHFWGNSSSISNQFLAYSGSDTAVTSMAVEISEKRREIQSRSSPAKIPLKMKNK